MRKYLVLSLIIFFAGMVLGYPQEDEIIIVKGTIEQIADDGSYIVVDGKKLITSQELIDEAYFAAGDPVEIKASGSPEGLRLLSYEYIYEDEVPEGDDNIGEINYDDYLGQ